MTNLNEMVPDIKVSVNQIFGIDTEMKVDGFSKKNEYVPEIDSNYKFDRDTTLAITFTPQALGSTFFIVAYQYGRNGVSSDSSFHRFFLMRSIAGGTASELQSYIYLGSQDHTHDYDIWPLTYKDSPTYTAGQTINYHIEVGFYTGNYSLNFRAQESSHPSRIFVYEMGA